MHPVRADTLLQLRQSVAQIDAGAHALTTVRRPLPFGIEAMDAVLDDGLAFGALHELAPVLPVDAGAACGFALALACLLYTSPSPRDRQKSRMPSSA